MIAITIVDSKYIIILSVDLNVSLKLWLIILPATIPLIKNKAIKKTTVYPLIASIDVTIIIQARIRLKIIIYVFPHYLTYYLNQFDYYYLHYYYHAKIYKIFDFPILI